MALHGTCRTRAFHISSRRFRLILEIPVLLSSAVLCGGQVGTSLLSSDARLEAMFTRVFSGSILPRRRDFRGTFLICSTLGLCTFPPISQYQVKLDARWYYQSPAGEPSRPSGSPPTPLPSSSCSGSSAVALYSSAVSSHPGRRRILQGRALGNGKNSSEPGRLPGTIPIRTSTGIPAYAARSQ